MNPEKTNKHDRYVLELYKQVQDRYDYLILDYEIASKKRKLGQIDLCGVRGDKMDLFEVKCSPRFHKAKKQLIHARKLIHSSGSLFFYCGSSGQLHEIV